MIGQLGVGAASINLSGGLVLIIFGLIMTFFGRKIAKIITFLVGGVVGALFTYRYLVPWMKLEAPVSYVAAIVAFIVVGFLAIALLYLSAGIAAGAAVFLFTRPLFQEWIIPLLLAAIAFAVVLILFNKLLSVGTAILGGIIVAYGLSLIVPIGSLGSIIVTLMLAVLGSYYQLKH